MSAFSVDKKLRKAKAFFQNGNVLAAQYECKEILEAIEEVASEEGSTDTKKSKIPKKKKKKKSKIPKFKKTN